MSCNSKLEFLNDSTSFDLIRCLLAVYCEIIKKKAITNFKNEEG